MYSEDDMIMISALQHYHFCRRQCALIHVDQCWHENVLTAEGRVLHEHVDSGGTFDRKDIRTACALRISSHELGFTGIADIVEFYRAESPTEENGAVIAVKLPKSSGFWKPFPVEYKHGTVKNHDADRIQLCAQAICMEETFHVHIPCGALFYGKIRRREQVEFTPELRKLTAQTALEVHQLIESGEIPPPVHTKLCGACSLVDICCPSVSRSEQSAACWLEHEIEEILQ